MKKAAQKRGLVIFLGFALIVSAVVLLLGGGIDSLRAGDASGRVLAVLNQRRPEPYAADLPSTFGAVGAAGSISSPDLSPPTEEEQTMLVEEVDGIDYLGSLAIPTLNIDLPVAAETDDERLRISPCRYDGSYLTDDLVICGEGYATHFGDLGTVGIRDEVRFVTVDGAMYRYVVSNVETDELDDIDKIMDDWDLTIFTFNADDTCCVVRCIRTS